MHFEVSNANGVAAQCIGGCSFVLGERIVSANASPSVMPSKVSIGNRIQWGGLVRFIVCRHDASV